MSAVLHPRLAARRGAARATTWWGKAWVRAVEESAYAESDLVAARSLSRSGRIGGIKVEEAGFVAAVEDGHGLWTVSGTVPVLEDGALATLVEIVAAESGRIASLLAGDLPHTLVEHADEAGVELLPYGGELGAACTCQAWVDPCVHALATLYQLTWLIEADPFVLLQLRGLPRDDLLARLHERTQDSVPTYDDVETGLEAALRAVRLLELLESPPGSGPTPPEQWADHLF